MLAESQILSENILSGHSHRLGESFEPHNLENVNAFQAISRCNSNHQHHLADVEGVVLDKETIKNALSRLGRTSDGSTFAYLEINLISLRLVNIDALSAFEFCQFVNVSGNALTSLRALRTLPNLLQLNASRNALSVPFDFIEHDQSDDRTEHCHPIKFVDYSFNQIDHIPNWLEAKCRKLETLILDKNLIGQLSEGLAGCRQLHRVSLAHNRICRVANGQLNEAGLTHLDLSYNQLHHTLAGGIERLCALQELNVAGNKLSSLTGFTSSHSALEHLDLEYNEIVDVEELEHLKRLKLLRTLNLHNNPICEISNYRSIVLFELANLTHLDKKKIDIYEKVKAQNMFEPSMEIVAARDHRINMVNQLFKAQTVLDCTLQSASSPYPMLILVGPQGSGKKQLARRLVADFPDFFGLAVCHTDRSPRQLDPGVDDVTTTTNEGVLSEEVVANGRTKAAVTGAAATDEETEATRTTSGSTGAPAGGAAAAGGVSAAPATPVYEQDAQSYHFVTRDQFDMLRIKGRFIETCCVQGDQFGLSIESVENIASEGLACVVHMELEGVLCIKRTYFEPRYVLIMPLDEAVHEARLRQKLIGFEQGYEARVEDALRRAELYRTTNQTRPGFFDKFIASDELDVAYANLKRLIMDYLGLSTEFESGGGVDGGGAGDESDRLNNAGDRAATSGAPNGSSRSRQPGVNRRISSQAAPFDLWRQPSGSSSGHPHHQHNQANKQNAVHRIFTGQKWTPNSRSSKNTVPLGLLEQQSIEKRKNAARNVISGGDNEGRANHQQDLMHSHRQANHHTQEQHQHLDNKTASGGARKHKDLPPSSSQTSYFQIDHKAANQGAD